MTHVPSDEGDRGPDIIVKIGITTLVQTRSYISNDRLYHEKDWQITQQHLASK